MRIRALVSAAALIAGVGVVGQVSPANAACTFTVASIAPAAGFTPGGLTTTVTGTCFTDPGTLAVNFGGTAVTPGAVTATTFTVITPAHAAGSATVAVTLAAASGSTTFTYVTPPSLASIIPTQGPEKGGTTVEVTGANLNPAGSTTAVKFGPTASPTVTGLTATGLNAVSPAGTGSQNVTATVTLTGGASATSNGIPYLYVPAPKVTDVGPRTGTVAGGTNVVITGSDFQPGASVFFGPVNGSPSGSLQGDAPARPTSVLSSTSIRATTPAGIVGPTNIVVVNPDGQLGALNTADANHYSYSGTVPSITGVTTTAPTPPALADSSLGGIDFTVAGAGFLPGVSVLFGAVDPAKVAFVTVSPDGTTITGKTPPHAAGLVDVSIVNIGGGTATKVGAYTFVAAPAPVIGSLSVSSGPSLGRTTLTVTGTNFVAGSTVNFDGVPAASAAVLGPTTMSVTTPAHAPGNSGLTVKLPDGQTTSSAFTFNASPAPTIGSISPSSGIGGTQITITGTGFANTNGAATNAASEALISVGSAACVAGSQDPDSSCLKSVPAVPPAAQQPIVVSATSIAGLVPNAPGGAVTVTVRNPDGQTAAGSFTYTGPTGPPVIASISPATGNTLGGVTVTLSGSGFVRGASLTFGAAGGTNTARISTVASADGTSLTALTPAGIYGLVDVTVTNPGGLHTTLKHAFTFTTAAQPTITSVSPSSGPGGTTVTITGTGFANTNGASTNASGAASVTVAGQSLLPLPVPPGTPSAPVVTSDTTIIGQVPTPQVGVSAADVAVMNPDGQGVILLNGFTYPADTAAPTLTVGGKVGLSTYTFGDWARGSVTVTMTANDNGGSGVKNIAYSAVGDQPIVLTTVPTSPTNVVIANQGITTITATASDLVIPSNVSAPVVSIVKVDSIKPALGATAATSGGPYVSGTITNQDVTVTFSCTDAGSGVGTLAATSLSTTTSSGTNPLAVTVTSVGLNQSVTATCTDVAGNVSTSTFGNINITRTAPAISATATAAGAPYTAGVWTNKTVTVTFTCIPIAIGNQIASLSLPVQVNGPTTNFTVTGTCTDTAGNSSTTTFGTPSAGIDIDLTLPVATASATTTNNLGAVVPYTAGTWTNHDVVVTFACTDTGTNQSGLAQIDPPITVSAPGITSGVVGGCRDNAGNLANPPAFFGSILIDKTIPVCSVAVTPNPIGPANSKLVAVTAAVTTTDAQSGPNNFVLVSLVSNSPTTAGADIVGFTVGSASTSGQLRATKGRTYTFTYQSFDKSANASAPCSKVVTVR
jgi:IPT/TIG domain